MTTLTITKDGKTATWEDGDLTGDPDLVRRLTVTSRAYLNRPVSLTATGPVVFPHILTPHSMAACALLAGAEWEGELEGMDGCLPTGVSKHLAGTEHDHDQSTHGRRQGGSSPTPPERALAMFESLRSALAPWGNEISLVRRFPLSRPSYVQVELRSSDGVLGTFSIDTEADYHARTPIVQFHGETTMYAGGLGSRGLGSTQLTRFIRRMSAQPPIIGGPGNFTMEFSDIDQLELAWEESLATALPPPTDPAGRPQLFSASPFFEERSRRDAALDDLRFRGHDLERRWRLLNSEEATYGMAESDALRTQLVEDIRQHQIDIIREGLIRSGLVEYQLRGEGRFVDDPDQISNMQSMVEDAATDIAPDIYREIMNVRDRLPQSGMIGVDLTTDEAVAWQVMVVNSNNNLSEVSEWDMNADDSSNFESLTTQMEEMGIVSFSSAWEAMDEHAYRYPGGLETVLVPWHDISHRQQDAMLTGAPRSLGSSQSYQAPASLISPETSAFATATFDDLFSGNTAYGDKDLSLSLANPPLQGYYTDYQGVLTTPDGTHAGSVKLSYYPDPEDKSRYLISGNYMALEPAFQDANFADEFLNDLAMKVLANDGTRHFSGITVGANLSVGGYAWAKRGLTWSYVDSEITTRAELLRDFLAAPDRPSDSIRNIASRFGITDSDTLTAMGRQLGTEKNIAELDRLLDRASRSRTAQGDAPPDPDLLPQPIEFAMAGYGTQVTGPDGRNYHVGKLLLLGTSWTGVIRFPKPEDPDLI